MTRTGQAGAGSVLQTTQRCWFSFSWVNYCILSWVYGSMTDNKEVLDWMIGFIDTSLYGLSYITINYKNSQSIFSRSLVPWLPRTRPILILVLRLSPTELRRLLYPLGTDHTQKAQLFYCCVRLCWDSHVIATKPVRWRACCCLAAVSARTT
jgi:hypothetical protein